MRDELGQERVFAAKFLRDWRENRTTVLSPRSLAIFVLIAVVYFVAGILASKLAFIPFTAPPVWPTTGIALAAFLLLGYQVWPAILIGAFAVELTLAASIGASVAMAIGNTAEGLLGAYLVNRFAGGWNVFSRSQYIFRFAVLAAAFSTMLGATFGVTSLCLGGFANWADYQPLWVSWWLGDAVGDAMVAPLLVLWVAGPLPPWDRDKLLEAIALATGLFLAGLAVFGNLSGPGINYYLPASLCIPFLLWAAFRFVVLEAAMAVPILSGIAIWGTLHGHGPFVRRTQIESLLTLQVFLAVVAVMTIAVAAVVSERKRVEEALRKARDEMQQMAATDPLTGLANFRRLGEALNAEAERSKRTGRSFALLLLDLNALKKLNDKHGHLAGSRALCRVANILQLHCRRAIDTAARYGGDEFALLLPETGAEGARFVGERIAEQVANDNELPAISVSFGVAVYPEDGETIEGVFRTADAALYGMKGGDGR